MSETDGCKIDDVVDRRGLESVHAEFDDIHENLLALWKGEGSHEERGYRSLAEWFNMRLMKAVYDAHGRVTIGSRLEDEYETLTAGDDLARGELLDDLAQEGIDGDALVDEMTSWSTMRRHLIDCLDGEKETQTADTDWERESVDIAREQLVEKVQKALSSYETKSEVAGATGADISVRVQLSCPECPTRRSLTDAIAVGYVCQEHLGKNEPQSDER